MKTTVYEYCNVERNLSQDSLSTFLDSCGLTVKNFGYQTEMPYVCPRIYGDLELIYLLSGDGILNIDGKTYHGKAHDMFILPKHSVCSFNNPGDPFENYYIHIDINDPIGESQLKYLFHDPLLKLGEDPCLMQYYRLMEQYYQNGVPGCYMAINSILQLILIRVIYLSGAYNNTRKIYEKYNPNSNQYQILKQSIELVTDKKGVITVSELCREMFVSPSYMRRIFQNMLGQSLQSFISSVRIHEAEKMLLNTSKPISEIALLLGFSSPYHLSNDFKKYHGVSPNKYRKLMFQNQQ